MIQAMKTGPWGSGGEGSIHIHPFTMKTFIEEDTPR